jgi:hypothetical protein
MRMRQITPVILFAVASLVSGQALAISKATGKITNFHLNSTIPGRGVCVQASPALPTAGFACLFKNNPLYQETTELLLDAWENKRKCNFYWNSTDPTGHAILEIVECF